MVDLLGAIVLAIRVTSGEVLGIIPSTSLSVLLHRPNRGFHPMEENMTTKRKPTAKKGAELVLQDVA